MEESALHGLNQDTIKPRLRIVCPSEIVGGADISIIRLILWVLG